VVPTGVQAEVATGGKATAALRDGVVGGGVMDAALAGAAERCGWWRHRGQRKAAGWCGASALVGSGGADSGGGGAGQRRWW
jgi:hypothetical protein